MGTLGRYGFFQFLVRTCRFFSEVNAIAALVINHQSLIPQKRMQQRVAIGGLLRRQLLHSGSQWLVIPRLGYVAVTSPAYTHQTAGRSLAQTMILNHVTRRLLAGSRLHHFFERTSFIASFSSSFSTRSFLSLLFYDSRSLRRLASLNSSPAYLLRH